MPKFRRTTFANSKVISANFLHFKPISDTFLKKVVKKAFVPVGGALVILGHFVARAKNFGAQHSLGAEIWFFKKCNFGWYDSTSSYSRSLDQNLPDLFC